MFSPRLNFSLFSSRSCSKCIIFSYTFFKIFSGAVSCSAFGFQCISRGGEDGTLVPTRTCSICSRPDSGYSFSDAIFCSSGLSLFYFSLLRLWSEHRLNYFLPLQASSILPNIGMHVVVNQKLNTLGMYMQFQRFDGANLFYLSKLVCVNIISWINV